MRTLPAASSQMDEFVRLQTAVDALIEMADTETLNALAAAHASADRPEGQVDQYLVFGQFWWQYMTTGLYYLVGAPSRAALEPHVVPSLSLGACIQGMSRTLMLLARLDYAEFNQAVGGMLRARRRALAGNTHPINTPSDAETAFTHPLQTRPSVGALTPADAHRNATASANFTLILGGSPIVTLADVDLEYAIRLDLLQRFIDDLREDTPAYDGPWDPTAPLNSDIELGPGWATFYHCAVAHAVGGTHGADRLAEIGVPFDAETCLAGIAETYYRLVALDPPARSRAFASIDCANYYFDPVPDNDFNPHP